VGPRRFGPFFPSQLVAENPHSQKVRDYRRLDEQSAQDVLIVYEIDKSVSSAEIQITSQLFFSEISENSAGIEPFADPRLSDFTGFLFHDVDGGVN
jgi:hypothetical protein